eukprot:Skav231536  [mRNA]  locus=scaffold84:695028:705445:- [translate_table: standard]
MTAAGGCGYGTSLCQEGACLTEVFGSPEYWAPEVAAENSETARKLPSTTSAVHSRSTQGEVAIGSQGSSQGSSVKDHVKEGDENPLETPREWQFPTVSRPLGMGPGMGLAAVHRAGNCHGRRLGVSGGQGVGGNGGMDELRQASGS